MTEKFNGQMVTEEAIIIWTDSLFQAKSYRGDKNPNAKKSHSCTLLFKKGSEGANEVLRLAKACADHHFPEEQWSDLATEFLEMGDKKADDAKRRKGKTWDYLRGYLTVAVNTPEENPPEIVDVNGDPVLPGSIKGGEVVRAYLNIAPKVNNDQTPGVKAYLNGVLLVAKIGETHPDYGKLTKIGGASAADAFSQYMGKRQTTDPSDGVDLDGLA